MNKEEKIQIMYANFEKTGYDVYSDEFSKLMNVSRNVCYSFLRTKMRESSDDDVKDVLSDVIVRIYLNHKTYSKGCPFIYWMYRICYNCMCTFLKNKRLYTMVDISNIDIENDYPEPDAGLMYNILPKKDKDIFMRKFNGASLKDISIEDGISIPSVKIKLFRYRNETKKILIDELK